jgi:hypothetical protein
MHLPLTVHHHWMQRNQIVLKSCSRTPRLQMDVRRTSNYASPPSHMAPRMRSRRATRMCSTWTRFSAFVSHHRARHGLAPASLYADTAPGSRELLRAVALASKPYARWRRRMSSARKGL